MKTKLFSLIVVLSLALSACAAAAPSNGLSAYASTATVQPAQATYTALPTYTPYPTQPAANQPAANQPAANQPIAQPSNSDGSYQTFTYKPGGEGFGQVGYDVTNPQGQTGCFRVWQATNLKNLAWTSLFCNWKASEPAPKQQWPHPTQLTISGTGTVEFDLYRDFAEPGAYDVANAQKSPLGLGWFTQGFNGSTCVDGKCQDLSGGGVFQLSFPKDWTGHYHVVITVNDGQVQFWQGERATSTDNWPTP